VITFLPVGVTERFARLLAWTIAWCLEIGELHLEI